MKSSEYWKLRFQALEEESYQKGEACRKDIQEQFRIAANHITREIEHWYQRLADNNNISLVAAKQLLKQNELKEFQWSVKQYIKAGKENAIDQRWMKQLENASARYHISHLEAMKLQMQQHCESLCTTYQNNVTDFLKESYQDTFYRTAYEIQKGTGIGSNFTKLDQRKIDAVLSKPWAADGSNFSNRIWKNKEKLVKELHTELSQSLIRGESPDKAIKHLTEKMEVSEKQVKRLVLTELAAIRSKSRLDSYKALDVEQYQIIAIIDSKTSELCQELNRKVFLLKDYEVGITAPPFHVCCRSDIIPYYGDDNNNKKESIAKREVTKEKSILIPKSMNYSEWKKTFIKDEIDTKHFLSKTKNMIDVLTRNNPPIPLSDLEGKFTGSISRVIQNAPTLFENVIIRNVENIVFAKTNTKGNSRYVSRYGIFVNLKEDFFNSRGRWSTLFHEIGHNIDKIYKNPSESENFVNALKNDFFSFTNTYAIMYNITIEEVYKELSSNLRKGTNEETHIFSDLFEALSDGKCKGRFRHGKGYWTSDRVIGHETFAHFFSASITNNEIKLEAIKGIFPNAYKEFLRIVGEMK